MRGKKNNLVLMHVPATFKNIIKAQAAKRGKSMIEYCKDWEMHADEIFKK